RGHGGWSQAHRSTPDQQAMRGRRHADSTPSELPTVSGKEESSRAGRGDKRRYDWQGEPEDPMNHRIAILHAAAPLRGGCFLEPGSVMVSWHPPLSTSRLIPFST